MADKKVLVVGLGFTSLLTLLFIVLKLTGAITWSWLWVLSPLWIGFVVRVVVAFVLVGVTFFAIFAGACLSRKL